MQTEMLIGSRFVKGTEHEEKILNPKTGETILTLPEASAEPDRRGGRRRGRGLRRPGRARRRPSAPAISSSSPTASRPRPTTSPTSRR